MLRSILCLLVGLGAVMNVAGQIVLPAGDSLAVVPVHPTSADPITLNLIIRNWDCCTQYTFDSIVAPVSDTEILLACQYTTPQVCPMIACINTDKVLSYKCAPLPAGTYAVYESKQLACLGGQICPELVIMAPVKIGEITVVKSTGVISHFLAVPASNPGSQNEVREFYNARGERLKISGVSGGRVPGVYFLKTSRGQSAVQSAMIR